MYGKRKKKKWKCAWKACRERWTKKKEKEWMIIINVQIFYSNAGKEKKAKQQQKQKKEKKTKMKWNEHNKEYFFSCFLCRNGWVCMQIACKFGFRSHDKRERKWKNIFKKRARTKKKANLTSIRERFYGQRIIFAFPFVFRAKVETHSDILHTQQPVSRRESFFIAKSEYSFVFLLFFLLDGWFNEVKLDFLVVSFENFRIFLSFYLTLPPSLSLALFHSGYGYEVFTKLKAIYMVSSSFGHKFYLCRATLKIAQ